MSSKRFDRDLYGSDFQYATMLLDDANSMVPATVPVRSQVLGKGVKRTFDIVFSVFAILSFLVPMILVAVALKVSSRGPILFTHERVGRDGKKFQCLKFRTMVMDADERLQALLETDEDVAAEFAETQKIMEDPRIIPHIGAFLRKLSIDELPQFFNVLKGDMSVVGPRPVTENEIRDHYGFGHAYMNVRPGITGLWQVSGRNDIGYGERVALDAKYVETWSFSQDLSIILRTAVVVCRDRNGH